MLRKSSVYALLVCVVATSLACGKTDKGHGTALPADGPDKPYQQPQPVTDPAKAPHVVFEVGGEMIRVDVEVVRTAAKIQQGLMYRTFMPENRGMLFIFPREKINSFWMKNTLIPLDMIFIRSDKTVAGIVENAEPKTDVSRRVDVPSQYVLEVNGGWSARNSIGPGSQARFVNVP